MKIFSTTLLFIGILLVGCTDNSAQNTLEANHLQVSTQVAELRLEATIQAARAQTTLDFIATRSSAAATQSQFLEATLIATGVAPASLADFRQRQFNAQLNTNLPPTSTLLIRAENEFQAAELSSNNPLHSPTPTLPAVSPFAPVSFLSLTPEAVTITDPNAPRLENAVTASGVGNDDCATGVTSQFATTASEIYIVAEAVNVPAGSIIESRWYRGGEPVGPVYDFRPDFDIERACIWFFVDPTDFEFIAGQYSVQLILNAVESLDPIPFTIGG
jgi:hypothetical protein